VFAVVEGPSIHLLLSIVFEWTFQNSTPVLAFATETPYVGWLGGSFGWELPCCPEARHLSGPLATGDHEVLLTGELFSKLRGSASGVGSCRWLRAAGLWLARLADAKFRD